MAKVKHQLGALLTAPEEIKGYVKYAKDKDCYIRKAVLIEIGKIHTCEDLKYLYKEDIITIADMKDLDRFLRYSWDFSFPIFMNELRSCCTDIINDYENFRDRDLDARY